MSIPSLSSFVPLTKLGEGTFSSVYKVKRINDQAIYALKKIKIANLKQKQRANALNEIRILASLSSPYIITYKQAFFDQKLHLLCIVMQWANQGDLLKHINQHKQNKTTFTQQQIWKAAYHISSGLKILHRNSILHRDLKSANIFICDGVYKLGDLNVSKVNGHQQRLANTQTGTPFYASPQIWRDQPYGSQSDIWSLGCILYEMCCLRPPFNGTDLNQLYRNVQRGQMPALPRVYSRELDTLIRSCLKQKAYQRPTTQQLLNPKGALMMKCDYYEIARDKQQGMSVKEKLLKTIKMPTDIKKLNSQLPQSKYFNQNQKDLIKQMSKDMSKDQYEMNQCNSRPKNYCKSIKTTPDPKRQARQQISKGSQIKSRIQQSQLSPQPQCQSQILSKYQGQLNLPDRIKQHLNNINRMNYPRAPRRILTASKQKINSNITQSSHQLISKKIQDYITPVKDRKKQRPLSCNYLNLRPIPQNKSPYYIDSLNHNPRPQPSYCSDRKLMPSVKKDMFSDRRYNGEEVDPYCLGKYGRRQMDKVRCQSASIKDPISAYSEVKQRLEARYRNIQPSSYNRGPVKLRSQIRSQASIDNSKQLKYVLPSSLSAQRYRAPNLQRLRQDSSNSYLQQIQNKILSSALPNARKCQVGMGVRRQPVQSSSQIRRYVKGQNVFRAHRV